MSPSPKAADFNLKAADFNLFAKGVDREALQYAAGFLGSLTPTQVEDAEGSIQNAAWHFCQAIEKEGKSLSPPTFAQNLGETVKTARVLTSQLNSIGEDAYSVALHFNLFDIKADRPSAEYDRGILLETLLLNPVEIQRRLYFLIDALLALKKPLSNQGLDVGTGRTNLYKSLNGPPKWGLALECHSIFEDYRPGEAKSKTGGPFYCFYTAVHGVALGTEPEDKGIGASYYIEPVCRIFSELAPLQTRSNEIRHALRNPDFSKKTKRELMKERDKIIEQLRAIKSPWPWI